MEGPWNMETHICSGCLGLRPHFHLLRGRQRGYRHAEDRGPAWGHVEGQSLEFAPRSLRLAPPPLASGCPLFLRTDLAFITNSPLAQPRVLTFGPCLAPGAWGAWGPCCSPCSATRLLCNFGQVSLPLWASGSPPESRGAELGDRRVFPNRGRCGPVPHQSHCREGRVRTRVGGYTEQLTSQ